MQANEILTELRAHADVVNEAGDLLVILASLNAAAKEIR